MHARALVVLAALVASPGCSKPTPRPPRPALVGNVTDGDASAGPGAARATLRTTTFEGPFAAIADYCDRLLAGYAGPADDRPRCALLDPAVAAPLDPPAAHLERATLLLVPDQLDAPGYSVCRLALLTGEGWFVETEREDPLMCHDPSFREPTGLTAIAQDGGAAGELVSIVLTTEAHVRDDEGWVDGEESTLWLCRDVAAGAPRCLEGVTIACDPTACDDGATDAWTIDWSVTGDTLTLEQGAAGPYGSGDPPSPAHLSGATRARLGQHRLDI